MSPENCKITMSGKNILSKEDLFEQKISKIKTEKWFKTKY